MEMHDSDNPMLVTCSGRTAITIRVSSMCMLAILFLRIQSVPIWKGLQEQLPITGSLYL